MLAEAAYLHLQEVVKFVVQLRKCSITILLKIKSQPHKNVFDFPVTFFETHLLLYSIRSYLPLQIID